MRFFLISLNQLRTSLHCYFCTKCNFFRTRTRPTSQSDPDQTFYINLFDSKNNFKYIGTSAANWKNSINSIKTIVSNNEMGSRNVRVGAIEAHKVSQLLQPIEKVFGKAPKVSWGRLFMNFAVESDNESSKFLLFKYY